jgi:hypothetical protein
MTSTLTQSEISFRGSASFETHDTRFPEDEEHVSPITSTTDVIAHVLFFVDTTTRFTFDRELIQFAPPGMCGRKTPWVLSMQTLVIVVLVSIPKVRIITGQARCFPADMSWTFPCEQRIGSPLTCRASSSRVTTLR